MKKSVLALILAVLMAVGLLTIGAAADDPVASIGDEKYDTLAQAVEKANDGDTIKVLQDVDISESGLTIPAEKSLTLDINGKEIEVANTNTGRIAVNGSLTIKDSTDTEKDGSGTGKIYSESPYNANTKACLIASIGENALVTLESGYIYAVINNPSSQGQFGLGVLDGGDLTVTGGKVEAGWYAISGNGTYDTQNSVINISGGILISTADYAVYLPQSGTTNITGGTIYGAAGGVCSQRGELNISGDVLITSKGTGDTGDWGDGTGGLGNAALYVNAEYGECDVAITGGTFTAEGDAVSIATGAEYAEGSVIEITGGTFTGNVSQFVPEGMKYDADTGKVVIDEEKAVASIGNVGYTSLESAIDAAEDGDTITLRKELNSENETFTITKDITITGEKMTVTRTAAGVAFEIKNGGKLTFDNLKLEINGDPDSCGNEGDAVTKGIDVYDGELFFIDSEVDFNNLRSAIVMQKTVSRANIVSSLVSANNVWGNFSNGGYWHIIGSSLNISGNKGSKGHGLSANELEIWDSTVNINFCGLLGLTAKRLDVDNSTITVNECGTQLPYTSEWSTDKKSYKYPVEIKNGGSVTIDEDSTVTLMNNLTGNVLYLVNSTLTADGTLNASIRTNSGSECYIVSIEGFNPMVVASGDTVKLPTVSKPGYIFMGWKCSDGDTHQAGETVTITGNMTFTAIWANMPDITPGTPGGDDEPVVPDFPFTDVREGQWFYEAVKYVYDEGIMNGMDRYTFDPNGSLTRAMVWTMLARHEGVDTEGGATWYAKAQEWAVEAGVSDGTDPMVNITREQLVTMLWRLNGSETVTGSLTGFTDYDKVSDWAGNAMLWATVNGIIEGDEANALNPTAGCTRAQAAAMIMRFCAYHEGTSFGTVV